MQSSIFSFLCPPSCVKFSIFWCLLYNRRHIRLPSCLLMSLQKNLQCRSWSW
jgi:hypothetical protein